MVNQNIKEILNNIKIVIDERHYRATCDIDYEDCKILYDYITSLQDELKSANESITWWTNRFKAVEKENQRLKEINKEQANHLISKDNLSYEDYKSRCEKAIEYIDNWLFEVGGNGACMDYEDIVEIKKILIEHIEEARHELNVILQSDNDLNYKNECSIEFEILNKIDNNVLQGSDKDEK